MGYVSYSQKLSASTNLLEPNCSNIFVIKPTIQNSATEIDAIENTDI